MATCILHPEVETGQPCGGCGRPFCGACLVEIVGRPLCESCKLHVISRMTARSQQHPLALMSLLVPLLGYLVTFGLATVVTSSIGLVLGLRVLRELRERPYYSGRSLALVGLVWSGGTLASFLIALVSCLLIMSGPR